jgi:hypothetical protein
MTPTATHKISVGAWWPLSISLALVLVTVLSFRYAGIFRDGQTVDSGDVGEKLVIGALCLFIVLMSVPYLLGIAKGDSERETGPFITTGEHRGTSRTHPLHQKTILKTQNTV